MLSKPKPYLIAFFSLFYSYAQKLVPFVGTASLLSILFYSVVFADDKDIPIVEYSICRGVSDRNYLEQDIKDLLDKTHEYMVSKNIEISFVSESLLTCDFTIPDTIAQIRYYEETNSEGIIDTRKIVLTLSDEVLSEISPILSNDLSIPISTWNDRAYELLATFLLYALGNIENAEETLIDYRESIDDSNLLATIDYYLGNIELIKGNQVSALDLYNDQYWLSANGYPTFYGTNLAWTLLQTGDSAEAIKIMTDGVEGYEGIGYRRYLKLLIDRAQLYALTFDYTSAIADLDTAIDHARSNNYEKEEIASLYKLRGDIIMLIYEWNRALDDYNRAIELDPNYTEAYYRRGILLYTMVEREQAITDFETYLQLDPDGQFAETAHQYIDDIQNELSALGG